MEREGLAIWRGGLKAGKGNVSTGSKALVRSPYGYRSRFEHETGTNPEELIGAAHAACFSMALAGLLEKDSYSPEAIETKAKVFLELRPEGPFITKVHLHVDGKVPGIDSTAFEEAAHQAKETCPVSRLLDVPILLDIALDNRGTENSMAV